jgi:predicted RNA-binding Zn-ribbon protein involved in translation (DUF1610 family)
MGGVVLRCPNCGTVQPTDGECEACREAPVRYFCTNHDPGIWVDSLSCPQCGARFGDPEPVRGPTPPSPERPRPRPPMTVEPGPPISGTGDDFGPWGGGGPAGRPGPGDPRPTSPDLGSLVAAMLGAAARSRRGARERPPYEEFEEAPPRPRRGGGCLGRLFMLALLLFALMLLVPALLGALLNFG